MRKRTKRKVYALVDPIKYAVAGVATTGGEDLDKLRYSELSAIDAFSSGKATMTEWRELQALIAIAGLMSQRGVGVEVMSVCMQAADHLAQSLKRYERIGRMGATGPALVCWRDLYEYHDLQRTSISRAEYERFIEEAINRERSQAPGVINQAKEMRL